MKAPKKVIAAMAMATLLGGTGLQAFAAEPTTSDFTKTTGKNGQESFQETNKNVVDLTSGLTAKGDIKVNGEFTRTITAFPPETKDGHYLRVTMPISLDYEYNLDTHVMQSANNGKIMNRSVSVKTVGSTPNTENKAVNMSILGLNFKNGNDKVKYVETINPDNTSEVQVPFQLVITKHGGKVESIPLASIKDDAESVKKNTIKIEENTDVDIKIAEIQGLKVTDNGNILDGQKASIGHNMTMKFEYVE